MPPSRFLHTVNERFTFALHDVARLWLNHLNERFKPTGLRQLKWLVMGRLCKSRDGLVQKELAEQVGVEGPALVRMLDSMEAAGLVQRCSCPNDRRAKIVRLGAKAEPVLNDLIAKARELRAEVLRGIPEADIRTALGVLEEIGRRLNRS